MSDVGVTRSLLPVDTMSRSSKSISLLATVVGRFLLRSIGRVASDTNLGTAGGVGVPTGSRPFGLIESIRCVGSFKLCATPPSSSY